MSATANGGGEYQDVEAMAREIREQVADQLHDLVVERNGVGTAGEIADRVRNLGRATTRVIEARGRQVQARELGLPTAQAIRDEREALELVRATAMSLGEACGSYVVGMDLDRKRGRLESSA